ncbi:MAG TPA: NAD-dependent epimerase/dehydratase family protein [Chitinophagales bacterium]|nr:NAD-dependent epimerase/dehydratase family protein [Chitinophagales bacterium]HMW13318.1 NAD-dependent epimerase/dehydratase family protein [Chitinophagales bacterium]HNL57569.1 NAD-dependent epimerase/dehydratase family protein [Chitinophagales bacterium]
MVLVTGASGFLGGELVKQLVAQGESVRIIKRASSSLTHLQSIVHQLDIVEADILDIPSLEYACEGVEKIYHCAAVIGYDSSYYNAMYKCNIEGTANVVNVALSKNIQKLIHVSSIAAIGGKPNELITEETKWEKNEWTTHYGITKMLAEREIWRGIQEGLVAAIINPGIIVGIGHEHKSTMRIFKNIQQQKMPFYTNGINGFIAVEDVANLCVQLMNSDVQAERFIAIEGNYSFKTYFDSIATALQVSPPKKALNKTLGNFFLLLDYLASLFTNRKRGLTKENMTVSMEAFTYSNEKIKQQFNYTFQPLQEKINQIAQQLTSYERSNS